MNTFVYFSDFFYFILVVGLTVGRLQMSDEYVCDVVYGKYITDFAVPYKLLNSQPTKNKAKRDCVSNEKKISSLHLK